MNSKQAVDTYFYIVLFFILLDWDTDSNNINKSENAFEYASLTRVHCLLLKWMSTYF